MTDQVVILKAGHNKMQKPTYEGQVSIGIYVNRMNNEFPNKFIVDV